MNLLVLTGFWPTMDNPITGIFVVQQCAAFVRHGCEVRVAQFRNIIRPRSELLSPNDFGYQNILSEVVSVTALPEKAIYLPGVPSFNASSIGWSIARYIKRLSMAGYYPDAVLVHGMRSIGLSAPYWREFVKGKVVQVIHGVDPKLADQRIRERFISLIANSAQCFDATVVVGTPLLAHTACLGIKNSVVVPNGCEIPLMKTVAFSQRPITERRVLLSVSNLNLIKGIDYTLYALSDIARSMPHIEWEYRVVGDGPEKSRLKSLVVELEIADRVHFLGRLTYDATMKEIGDCDVFCLPSWREAFGIVYLEAMVRGRPVIGCWRNGAQDIVAHGNDGLLVEPQDVESLLNALAWLLTDTDKCSRMGRNARAKAEQFTWDANALRMLEICSRDYAEN